MTSRAPVAPVLDLTASEHPAEFIRCTFPDGSPMTHDRVIKAVRGAQRIAGIGQGMHILRHTFGSHLAMKGAPPRATASRND